MMNRGGHGTCSRREFLGRSTLSLASGLTLSAFVARAESNGASARVDLIRPPALRPGDLIALVSPGNAIGRNHKLRTLDTAVAAIEKDGYRVRVMPHARAQTKDGRAGTLEERVSDLNLAFADPAVRLIMGTVGGGGTLDVVRSEKLNWAAIRQRPKLICGFSDLSFLTVAAHVRLGLVTLDGPLAVFHWGSLPQPPAYATQSFVRAAAGSDVAFAQRPAKKISLDPFEFSGQKDQDQRLRPAQKWKWLQEGQVQARLLGVRADQLLDLLKAGIDVSLKGRIWCVDPLLAAATERAAMLRVRDRGLLIGVAGIVVGRPFAFGNRPVTSQKDTEAIIRELTADLRVPVLTNVDCGHTVPRMTIPNGVLATLDSHRNTFRFDESAVQPNEIGARPATQCQNKSRVKTRLSSNRRTSSFRQSCPA